MSENAHEKGFLVEEMTSPEVEEAMGETGMVIVHVGSMEQHGPHLPIKTDTTIGFEVSRRAADKFYRETGRRVLLAPSIRFGMSLHHMSYPGTISLQRARARCSRPSGRRTRTTAGRSTSSLARVGAATPGRRRPPS